MHGLCTKISYFEERIGAFIKPTHSFKKNLKKKNVKLHLTYLEMKKHQNVRSKCLMEFNKTTKNTSCTQHTDTNKH